jgi:hypothetical protein
MCRACADAEPSRSGGCGVRMESGLESKALEDRSARKSKIETGVLPMKKALPEKMFADDQTRMTVLRMWVLEQGVSEIQMSERQFWNFAALQPVSEKPWVTFMGRQLRVPDMPEDAQRCLGIHDPQRPGSI